MVHRLAKTRAIIRALTAAGVEVDLTGFNTADNDKILGSLVYGRTEELPNPLRKIASIGPGSAASFSTGDALEVASQMYAFGSVGWNPLNSELSEFDGIQSSSGTWVFVAGLNYGLRSPSGPNWDRIRSEGDNLDAKAVGTLGRLITGSRLYGFNGSTWDRVRVDFQTDGMAPVPFGAMQTASVIQGWNGTAHDRYRAVFDNQANPATGKMPTLPARANAAPPAWTEGNVVPLSVDLSGRTRTLPTPFLRSDGVAAFPSWRLAAPVTAPAAGGALVTVAAVVDQINRVFGVMAHQESETIDNLVELREGATVRTAFGVTGSSGQIISPVPILVPAANTAVSLNSRNAPGAGIDVVGALLVETAA